MVEFLVGLIVVPVIFLVVLGAYLIYEGLIDWWDAKKLLKRVQEKQKENLKR